ncbi:MAG: response regulator [Muribaculaceae bacterium]|nr:response regulator [Muribaculaceae bacterium]
MRGYKCTDLENTFKLFIIAFIAMIMLGISSCKNVSDAQLKERKNICFVSSFTDNHIWSSRLYDAFKSTLDTSKYDVQITNVYLDSKRIVDPEARRSILNYHLRSEGKNIELVVGMDLEATELLIVNPDSLIQQYPVVCVATLGDSMKIRHEHCVFINSVMQIDETFVVARKFLPNAVNAYIVSDSTDTGVLYKEEARRQLEIYENYYNIDYSINAKNDSDLLAKLNKINSENSFIILCTWQRGTDGVYYLPEKLYPRIATESGTPVFTIVDNMASDGFIGGYMERASVNGEALAKQVVAVFDGEKPSGQVKPLVASPVFNTDAMRSHNIHTDLIPGDSLTQNSLQDFVEINRNLILTLLIIIVVAIIVIVLLFKMSRRYKNLYRKSYKLAIKNRNLEVDSELLLFSLNQLNAYTWVVNLDTRGLHYIDSNSELRGIKNLQESIDDFIKRVHSEDLESFNDKFEMCVNGQSKNFKCVYRLNRSIKTDDYQWWETRGMVSERYDSSGNRYRALSGISYNVHGYKSKEQQLAQAVINTERSEQCKCDFFANMSHEIRTPLNVVVGFSELMTEARTELEREEYGDLIKTNSKLLLDLIDDILDLSKIESGMMKFDITTFDFVALYNEVYNSFVKISNKNVKIIRNDNEEHCMVVFDRRRLLQVLNNFMSNAIKYTDHGEITMSWSISDGGIKISVKDTGIGISDENKSKVFSQYQRFDSIAKGTGLGLSISKAIVEKHNGKIGFESDYGKGSTFWTWLPILRREVRAELPVSYKKEQELEKLCSLISGLNILVADDIDSNYRLIEAVFSNCTVEQAPDGVEAVIKARMNKYDLIIMDIRMPVLDGLEATRQIRRFDVTTPIVILTAHAFEAYREEAQKVGANDYITKPIDRRALLSIIKRLVQKG